MVTCKEAKEKIYLVKFIHWGFPKIIRYYTIISHHYLKIHWKRLHITYSLISFEINEELKSHYE